MLPPPQSGPVMRSHRQPRSSLCGRHLFKARELVAGEMDTELLNSVCLGHERCVCTDQLHLQAGDVIPGRAPALAAATAARAFPGISSSVSAERQHEASHPPVRDAHSTRRTSYSVTVAGAGSWRHSAMSCSSKSRMNSPFVQSATQVAGNDANGASVGTVLWSTICRVASWPASAVAGDISHLAAAHITRPPQMRLQAKVAASAGLGFRVGGSCCSTCGMIGMEGEQVIGDALRVGGCAEYLLLVVAQFAKPLSDVGRTVREIAIVDAQLGTDHNLIKLGAELLPRVVLRAEIAGQVAVEPLFRSGRVTELVKQDTRVGRGRAERACGRHLDVVGRR